MGRFLLVVILGSGIVYGIAWYFNLSPGEPEPKGPMPEVRSTPKIEFGDRLFPPKPDIPGPVFTGKGKGLAAIEIPAHLAVPGWNKPDVGSLVEGQILFIGEPVPDDAVALGGVAPFSAEPFSYVPINQGSKDLIVIYDRLMDSRTLRPEQIVAVLGGPFPQRGDEIRLTPVANAVFRIG